MSKKDGWQLALAGMSLAGDGADAMHEGWTERAYSWFVHYARNHRQFLNEEVRIAAYLAGFPVPKDDRAWGAIPKRAERAGIVRRAGHDTSRVAAAHCRPSTLWLSLVFRS